MAMSAVVTRRSVLAGAGTAVATAALSSRSLAAAPTTLVVGTGPNLSGVDLPFASQKGYFATAGATVKLQYLTAGSQAVPQLLGGQLQFATIDSIVALAARSRGIPIVVTCPDTMGTTDMKRGYVNLFVRDDGPVKTLPDLVGRTIAVNQIKGSAWAFTRALLDKHGVDSTKVHFLEVPPPQLLQALQQKNCEAAVIAEPLATVALDNGCRIVSTIEAEVIPSAPTFVYVAQEGWAKANAPLVNRFDDAILKAHREINAHRDEALEVAKTATRTPPALLPKVVMPNYGTEPLKPSDCKKIVDIAVKYGIVAKDKVPLLSSLLWRG
jgi:NitT/TauT family transport system substrate-binding protein